MQNNALAQIKKRKINHFDFSHKWTGVELKVFITKKGINCPTKVMFYEAFDASYIVV